MSRKLTLPARSRETPRRRGVSDRHRATHPAKADAVQNLRVFGFTRTGQAGHPTAEVHSRLIAGGMKRTQKTPQQTVSCGASTTTIEPQKNASSYHGGIRCEPPPSTALFAPCSLPSPTNDCASLGNDFASDWVFAARDARAAGAPRGWPACG